MPLIQTSTVVLPHIDAAAASPEQIQAAKALIEAELAADHATTLHPNLPPARATQFSALVEQEHARLAAGAPKTPGLDLSRYELLDPPEGGAAAADPAAAWQPVLQQAYASAQYLKARETNLGLLEAYGKNAWLISNSRVEDELRGLEKEVEAARLEGEQVAQARRALEQAAAGEMEGLEQSWRVGVGRMIETQAAAEGLRQQILERKRQQSAV